MAGCQRIPALREVVQAAAFLEVEATAVELVCLQMKLETSITFSIKLLALAVFSKNCECCLITNEPLFLQLIKGPDSTKLTFPCSPGSDTVVQVSRGAAGICSLLYSCRYLEHRDHIC